MQETMTTEPDFIVAQHEAYALVNDFLESLGKPDCSNKALITQYFGDERLFRSVCFFICTAYTSEDSHALQTLCLAIAQKSYEKALLDAEALKHE